MFSRVYEKHKSITPPLMTFSCEIYGFVRSSHRCFMKKAVLKNPQFSQENCRPDY